ncbi:hypothetical protein [Haloarcula laminariae]|uniref:hypothetical protein n=1 Tax=Haloarcula laminariae TaxID=2961577 RepID=UPI00240546F8|nr:hypothetical protein [Halomicroarcula sp. FL173]
MVYVTDPNQCAFCGQGLFEESDFGNPDRIGEVFQTGGSDAIEEMQGTPEQKREARQAFSIKVGVCPDCLEEYDLARGDLENLSNVHDEISLTHTENVPERDLSK